ncbi:chitinase domain-containing protein 1-like [Pogonomyrmex barbatus]|uniref:Chitinase domain-containing protein 1 n=1 Tax=Pogonomyrmex barbatus TaxID=144034 RepID=A0A6I9WKI7_9HYME|nr:chitinase domain-containing protein 1-like [Pogonomyrmex barbatus]
MLQHSVTTNKKSKKEKEKSNNKVYKGPVDQDVFQKNLVVENPKQQDILYESGQYFQNTKYRRFKGEVLGYCTPWNGNGFEISKIFHGKFTMLSPVWLTIPFGNTSTYQFSIHSVQTKWIKEIKANNNINHSVKLIPRILFEHWSIDDIIKLYSNTESQTKLIVSLLDVAQVYHII